MSSIINAWHEYSVIRRRFALESRIVRPISIVSAALLVVSLVGMASADTIKLKNGRTIVADRVKEHGDRVEYEIGDNTFAIRKSSVESISAGGSPVVSASTAVDIPEPPAQEPLDRLPDMTNLVIVNGAVDTDTLAVIEKQGNVQRTAAAYYAAGRFEHLRGNVARASEYMKEALR